MTTPAPRGSSDSGSAHRALHRLEELLGVDAGTTRADEDIDRSLERLVKAYESRCDEGEQFCAQLADLAHKINNPLTSLIGRSQLLKMNASADEQMRHAADVIEQSATRVAEYVREFALLVTRNRG